MAIDFQLEGVILLAQGTTAERTAIVPQSSQAVWDTVLKRLFIGDGVTAGGKQISPDGRHYVPVMAGYIQPSVTGGCAALASVASGANQPDIVSLDFDAIAIEYAQFSIPMPPSWDEGTVTFIPVWSHADTTTNFGVRWQLQGVAVSSADLIATAFGTAVPVDQTGTVNGAIYTGVESAAITIAGTPAAGDMVFFRVSRDPTHANDTMAIDARLHGIIVIINTNAAID